MLITFAEVADELGVSASDARLIRKVNATIGWAKRSLGRQFERRTYELRTRGYGGPVIFLRESPFHAITEVRIDPYGVFGNDTIVDLSTFSYNTDPVDDDNQLRYTTGCFPEGANTVLVKGEFGWWPADDPDHVCDLPSDLTDKLIEHAKIKFKEAGDDFPEEMLSLSEGDRSATKFEPTDKRILRELRRYKR
ncbi:MAG TPA: hypothetical protein VK504_11000 [Vicinamibacterales bacterium]|nr:hypothetical protein [Vicinamibacterales bacterium]